MSLSFKIKQFIFRKYRNSQIKKHELRYLFWECTLKCNLNCLHCGSDCTKNSAVPDMPAADFVRVLDGICKKRATETATTKGKKPAPLMVCITGGEPLLRPDLEDVGLKICERGMRWGIVTNALTLDERRFSSLFNAGLCSISFSLDGFAPQHAHLRQNGFSFERTVNAIRMAVAVQKKLPGRLVFDVITCVHRGNLHILPEFRDFLIQNGVREWRIFSIFPEGRAATNELSLSAAEYKQLMEFIAQTRRYKTADGKSIHLNYSCEGYLGAYELKARDFFFFCRGGVNVASVMCDGSITACLSVRAKRFIQGNIYKDDFMEVWNTRFLEARDRSWAKAGRCASCRNWKNCLGNGLHLHSDGTNECARCNYELLR